MSFTHYYKDISMSKFFIDLTLYGLVLQNRQFSLARVQNAVTFNVAFFQNQSDDNHSINTTRQSHQCSKKLSDHTDTMKYPHNSQNFWFHVKAKPKLLQRRSRGKCRHVTKMSAASSLIWASEGNAAAAFTAVWPEDRRLYPEGI